MLNVPETINVAVSVYMLIGIWVAARERRRFKELLAQTADEDIDSLDGDLTEIVRLGTMLDSEQLREDPRVPAVREKLRKLEERVIGLQKKRVYLERRNREMARKLYELEREYGEHFWTRAFMSCMLLWLPTLCRTGCRRYGDAWRRRFGRK